MEINILHPQLNNYYTKHQNQTIASLLPNQLVTFLDQHVDNATDLLCDRARNYLSSAKGTQDINDMLDTFSMRKVVNYMLQMFMTKRALQIEFNKNLYV